MKFPYRLGSRLQSTGGKRPEAVIFHSPLSLVGMPHAEIQMVVDTIDKPRRNSKDIGALVKSELRKLHGFRIDEDDDLTNGIHGKYCCVLQCARTIFLLSLFEFRRRWM